MSRLSKWLLGLGRVFVTVLSAVSEGTGCDDRSQSPWMSLVRNSRPLTRSNSGEGWYTVLNSVRSCLDIW